MRPRPLPLTLACAALLTPSLTFAAGLVGEGPGRRVERETFLVVWDHVSRVQHLVAAAQVSGLQGPGALLLPLPLDAQIDQPLAGVDQALGSLLQGLDPVRPSPGDAPALAPRPEGLAALCKTWKLTCQAEALQWADERFSRQDLALLPLSAPSSAYAHLRFEASRPFVPFSEPPEDRVEGDPPPPDEAHPPRVQIFVELFNESPSGRWERALDAAAEGQRGALVGCYSKALEQRRRLAGSLQVQLRMNPEGQVTVEDEQARSKGLEPVAGCFAGALAKAPWPRSPFKKPILFEVHATLRPPAATARKTQVVVLSTQDVEPRLGHAEDPRVVPELRSIASLEPEPEALRRAFPEELRRALGLDLTRRWRLVAFETGADPHDLREDIELRPLVLAQAAPGSTPMPVVARGDRPEARPTLRPRWWQRSGVRRGALALLGAGLLGWLLWSELRRREERSSG
ncbi:MAG: hypothetical protein MUF64_18885 [Polyangiaceae bacterium]|nr:hypothetical protein [Polyangiaceae bacterium]